MSMPKFSQLTGKESMTELIDIVAKIQKQLTWLMQGHLDSKNVREIGGWVVSLDSLESKDGTVGMSTEYTDANDIRFWAGSAAREAAPFQVYEDGKLVAKDGEFEGHISASIIEGGEVYGAYIASRKDGFPFVELSDTNNMLGAYKDANNSIQVYSPVDKLSPVVKWETNGNRSYIFYDPTDNTFSITSNDANVRIDSGGRLELYGSNGSYVQNWNLFKNNTSSRSLQQDLDEKANYGNQTGSAGSANGGIPPGTVLMTADGGTVTWFGISDHTHTQK